MRLAFHCPDPHNGTAWYRAIGPLGHIQRHYAGFNISPVVDLNIANALFTDVAFFQRPATYKEIDAMRLYRRAGVPVIVDYDDNDLNVPSDIPSYFHFADPDIRNAMLFAMEEATAVTVTTEALRQVIKKIYPNQHVYVVPNALDPVFHREKGLAKTDHIQWRGGVSHQRDLFHFAHQIEEFTKTNPKAFSFFGYHPWFLEGFIPEKQLESEAFQSSIANYLARLWKIAPKYAIVPLIDTPFNRCKSNISWLEMTWAGAVCLVPDWQEFNQPGTINYKSRDDFKEKLDHLVNISEEDRLLLHAQSWKRINERYTLTIVNRIRMELFMAAIGMRTWPTEEYATSDHSNNRPPASLL